ncbi:unnamed protein product [Prorocentrum cordatum]|uniref:Dienelactone hydrolase domain-containing protein n=1 Tax=Prorocentrum cordatum TaxID=2364126 RepID=A0ABN9TYU2_9DINO|nr:unnamed protein product [Polarella glacialis]
MQAVHITARVSLLFMQGSLKVIFGEPFVSTELLTVQSINGQDAVRRMLVAILFIVLSVLIVEPRRDKRIQFLQYLLLIVAAAGFSADDDRRSDLQGEEVSLGCGLQAYYAPPKASGRQMGVVVVHDVFGFLSPGCRRAVDRLAGKGYAALMPDLFGGKELTRPAWPSAGEPPEGPAFEQWLGEITSEPAWGALRADVRAAMDFLRGKGCKRFGVVGFGWGGRAAEVVASGPGAEPLAVVASLHGVRHGASTYREVRCGSVLYVAVKGDPFRPPSRRGRRSKEQEMGVKWEPVAAGQHGLVAIKRRSHGTGQIPVNEMQYRQIIAYIMRFGHLAEHGSHNIMNPAQSPSAFHATEHTFMTDGFGQPIGLPSGTSGIWQTGVFGSGAAAATDESYLHGGVDADATDDDGEANAVRFQRKEDEPDMTGWSNNEQAEFY